MFRLRKFLVMLFSLAAMMFIVACAGDDGKDGKAGTDGKDWRPENVTDAHCVSCHLGETFAYTTPSYIRARVLGSTAADNTMKNSFKGGVHFWSQRALTAGAEDTGCGRCHGRDYQQVRNMNSVWRFITVTADTVRLGPAGCIGCHGVDETGHFKVVNVSSSEYPALNADTSVSQAYFSCVGCHNASEDQGGIADTYHDIPHGNQYLTENAGTSYNKGNHARFVRTGACASCHTDAAKYLNPWGGFKTSAQLADYAATVTGIVSDMPVSCTTCHNAHTGELRTGGMYGLDNITAADGSGTLSVSSEFLLCTSCHMVSLKADGTLADAYKGWTVGEVVRNSSEGTATNVTSGNRTKLDNIGYHAGSYFQTMAATHFSSNGADVVTSIKYNIVATDGHNARTVGNVGIATGYGISANAPRPCTACHDPHGTTKFEDSANMATLTKSFITNSNHNDPNRFIGNASRQGMNCAPCHQGIESVKFMREGSSRYSGAEQAWSGNPYFGIQAIGASSPSSQTMTCGTCHDLNNTDYTAGTPGSGNQAKNIITGAVRAATNLANGGFTQPGMSRNANDRFQVPQGFVDVLSTNNLLVCQVCHSGGYNQDGASGSNANALARMTIFNANKATVVSFSNIAGYTNLGTSVHRAEGAVAAGFGYVSIPASPTGDIAFLSNPADTTTWPRHKNSSGLTANCAICHDVSDKSHSFRVFGVDGTPTRRLIQGAGWESTLNVTLLAGGCGCHSTGAFSASLTGQKAKVDGFEAARTFLGNAMRVIGSDGFAVQTNNNVSKDGAAFTAPTIANGLSVAWQNSQRFAVAINNSMLGSGSDRAPWAHGQDKALEALGISLKWIYLDGGGADTAADFRTWLEAGVSTVGSARGTAANTAVPAMGAAGVAYLCGASGCTNYTNW